MILTSLFLTLTTSIAWQQPDERESVGRVAAYRLDRIETLAGEALTNATVLVRDGVIERIGKAVIIPEHATVYDFRGSGAVMTPPLVLSHANFLQSDSRGGGNNSRFKAVDSLWLNESWAEDLWQYGVGMVGVDPPGSGAPGRTSALKVESSSKRPQALIDDLHLKLEMAANASAKKIIRGGFKAAEAAIENEIQAEKDWKKARKEWSDKQEAKKKEAEKAKADGVKVKEDKSEEEAPSETFEAPKIKENEQAFVDWVRKERVAQVHMRSAADWLHWQQLMDEREETYEVVFQIGNSTNLHEVVDSIAKSKVRVDVQASLSFLPYTRNRINLASELVAAGCEKLVLSPSVSNMAGVKNFRLSISRLLATGLDESVALRAITLEPSTALGQEEVMGTLTVGMPASFVIWSGDVFDPFSEVTSLVLDGDEKFNREQFELEQQR
ncbi:MAG: hypothetical protein ACI84O_000489 [Myxococcota bacterium]|jgi:hypothetical protein